MSGWSLCPLLDGVRRELTPSKLHRNRSSSRVPFRRDALKRVGSLPSNFDFPFRRRSTVGFSDPFIHSHLRSYRSLLSFYVISVIFSSTVDRKVVI